MAQDVIPLVHCYRCGRPVAGGCLWCYRKYCQYHGSAFTHACAHHARIIQLVSSVAGLLLVAVALVVLLLNYH
jgi:hypothetical protein